VAPQVFLFPENLFQKYDKNKNRAPLKCILPLQTLKPSYGSEYGAAQSVEVNHNEDSLFMALRMNYFYV